MAENEEAQEKTEEATPKRLEKAREEGQVARSRELGTTLILLGGSVGLWLVGGVAVENFSDVMRANLDFPRASALDPGKMFAHLLASFKGVIVVTSLLLVIMLFMGILANIVFGGWLWSAKPLTPRVDRLDPIAGLKRMFSLKSLVELLKAIGKFLLVAAVAVFLLLGFEGALLDLGREALEPALSHAITIILWSVLALSAITLVIAALDVPFQQFDYRKNLRMTRQQVKDEMKDTEGRPEVRGRVRQLQRQLATSRMMAEVPEADVIITNPEHFAVALKYSTKDAVASAGGQGAPVLVAKGADLLAFKIREIAEHHSVPVVQSRLLARAIFFTTEINSEIPEKLYLAVAQVLAFIHQIRERHRNQYRPDRAELRSLTDKIDIPQDLQFDSQGRPLDSQAMGK